MKGNHQELICTLMAENSVHNLEYKRFVFSSDNDKADIIQTELKQFTIALQIMAKYPEALNEYKHAVKGGSNHPVEEPTAPVEDVDVRWNTTNL
jgi:hypothetical protein